MPTGKVAAVRFAQGLDQDGVIIPQDLDVVAQTQAREVERTDPGRSGIV